MTFVKYFHISRMASFSGAKTRIPNCARELDLTALFNVMSTHLAAPAPLSMSDGATPQEK